MDNEFLIRIDERVGHVQQDVAELKALLAEQYVTQHEFRPVKLIVYGFVGTVLSALIVALFTLMHSH